MHSSRRRREAEASARWKGRAVGRSGFAVALLLLAGGLVACESDPFGDQDRYANLTRDDFREALEPRPVPTEAKAPDGPLSLAPELEPLLDLPPPSPIEGKLVSISVNETAPLTDVLIELARMAEVDLELDPRIEGGIILTMRDRPLRDVIERISALAGLRYEFTDQGARIALDEPYYANYRLDYLHVTRQSTSSIETSTSVTGGGAVEGNSSSSQVGGQSDSNFWQEVEASLTQILANSAPQAPVTRQVVAASATETSVETPGIAQVLGPTAALATPAAATDTVSAEIDEEVGEFTINRQAGIVSVFGNQRQHRLIEEYLSALHRSVTRQVLIEAKIMDVALSDEFNSGINWRAVFDNMYSVGAPLGALAAPGPFTGPFSATPEVVTLAVDNSDLDVIFNFVQKFGTVRTLSSPRVAVLQNQTAVLKVAENQVFFQLFFERIERDDGDDVVNISSEIRTVPVGVVITVQPSINETNGAISLALRPSVTRVTEVVNDPAVSIASNNTVESQIPVIAVQEIDSVVTMQSGQVVVMGGLMRNLADSEDEGVPVLGQLPGLGYLFKGHRDEYRKSELVIFLRATILEDGGIDPVDAELYRRFSGDRRPFPRPDFSP
jgi:general secretion pathway protein D